MRARIVVKDICGEYHYSQSMDLDDTMLSEVTKVGESVHQVNYLKLINAGVVKFFRREQFIFFAIEELDTE